MTGKCMTTKLANRAAMESKLLDTLYQLKKSIRADNSHNSPAYITRLNDIEALFLRLMDS